MKKPRFELARISEVAKENPYLKKGQKVIFDNATMQVLVIYGGLTSEFVKQELGAEMEVIDE